MVSRAFSLALAVKYNTLGRAHPKGDVQVRMI